MTPSERRRRFTAEIRRQIRRRGLEIDEGVVRLLGTLAELQQQTRNVLAATPTDFDAHRLPELLREVDRHIALWTQRATGVLEEGMERAWETGPELITGPLTAAEIQIGRTLLPQTLLDELKDSATQGLRDLGPVARQRIEATLRQAVLGGMSPHEAMRAIEQGLGRKSGPFKLINFRAETIYRTDVARIHQTAGDRRLKSAARLVRGLGKQWWWSHVSRTTHAAAHQQTRAADEKFDVGGEKLRFPVDPEGSPENTINCGCNSVPWMASWT